MHQRTNAPLSLSFALWNSHSLSLPERETQGERWKSRESCRSTSLRYSGNAAERHSLDFLIWIGRRTKHTPSKLMRGHRFLGRGTAVAAGSTRRFLDLRDERCTQGNCRLRCCENTQRWFEDCDLVAWVMRSCGWRVRPSIHRRSDTQRLRGLPTAQWEEKVRKSASLAAVWNIRTEANMPLIWSDPKRPGFLSNLKKELAFWGHFFLSTREKF